MILTTSFLGLPAPGTAQSHPDFSGHWATAPAGGGRGGGPVLGSGWGPGFTIVQRGDSLIVERPFFAPGDLQPPLKFRYALDGSEAHNTVLMGRGMQEQISVARWEGEDLVIVTRYLDPSANRGQGVTSEVRYVLSYQRARPEALPPLLVIETRRSGALGGTPSTTRTVYTRG